MHSQGQEQRSSVLAPSPPVAAEVTQRLPQRRTTADAVRRPVDSAPCRRLAQPTWFSLRATLIDLLRRSFFVSADPWAQGGSFELPHGGFVRWEWLDSIGAPVHVEINPGAGGPAGISADQLIERLVMLGWNTPEHPWSFCWLEAPRPEMWLRRDQRQRFADAADRIILALTVVLDLAPTDVVVSTPE